MHWCFGIVNGRLSRLFDVKRGGKKHIFAHSYIKASELQTKREREMMKSDVEKTRLSYRNKKYRRMEPATSSLLTLAG